MRTEPYTLPIRSLQAGISRLVRRETRSGGALLAVIVCALGLTGCQTPSKMTSVDSAPQKNTVVLQAGDSVKIRFPSSPEMDETQKIRADGRINLPVVGEVQASGKTPGDLQDDLESLYKTQLKNDVVVVTLEGTEMAVYVSGAVGKPGTIAFDRPTTALEAIMEAGGFGYTANIGSVHLIRVANGRHETRLLDLRPALSGKPMAVTYLKPGDIIYVPEKAFNF